MLHNGTMSEIAQEEFSQTIPVMMDEHICDVFKHIGILG